MLILLMLCGVLADDCCGMGLRAAFSMASFLPMVSVPKVGMATFLQLSDTGWDISVAAEQVPEGLDLAVQKMKRGETAEVTLAPRYAFGAEGAQRAAGAVPPDASVTYTVELREFENVRLGTHELYSCQRCVPAGTGAKPDLVQKHDHFGSTCCTEHALAMGM